VSPFEFKTKLLPILTIDKKILGDKIDLMINENEIEDAKKKLEIYKKSYGIDNKVNKFKVGDKIFTMIQYTHLLNSVLNGEFEGK
jgi:hypothetical protein